MQRQLKMPATEFRKHLVLSLQVVFHGWYVHSYINPYNNSMKLVLPSSSFCRSGPWSQWNRVRTLHLPAYLLSTWSGLGEEVGLWGKMVSPDKGRRHKGPYGLNKWQESPWDSFWMIYPWKIFFFNLPVTGTIWWLGISLCPGPAEMHKDEVSRMIRRKRGCA